MKTGGLTFLLVLCTITFTHQDYVYIQYGLDSLYDAYVAIQEAMTSDPRIVFKLKQAFFPSIDLRYWQVDGVDVIPIHVNITLLDQPQDKIDCNLASNAKGKNVMERYLFLRFQWTNSLLMNNIPGDILLAMDPISTAIIYSDIVGSYTNRFLGLQVGINRPSLFCTLSEDTFEQALALFLSRVSHW